MNSKQLAPPIPCCEVVGLPPTPVWYFLFASLLTILPRGAVQSIFPVMNVSLRPQLNDFMWYSFIEVLTNSRDCGSVSNVDDCSD